MEGCISNQIIKHSSWPPKLCSKVLEECPGGRGGGDKGDVARFSSCLPGSSWAAVPQELALPAAFSPVLLPVLLRRGLCWALGVLLGGKWLQGGFVLLEGLERRRRVQGKL